MIIGIEGRLFQGRPFFAGAEAGADYRAELAALSYFTTVGLRAAAEPAFKNLGGCVAKFVKMMLLALVFMGLSVAPAAAQTIGFKLGPTFSKLSVDDAEAGEEPETLTSFGGGGFIRFGFAGLALQAELLALTKGASTDIGDGTTEVDGELKFNYVEIPVTAMFSLGSGPYLFAGPAVAFETGCEISVESDEGSFETDCDAGEEEFPRKKTEFSLHGGAGFQFPVGPGSVLLEGRYIYGLTNLNDSDVAGDDSETKHRTWTVMAGFAIPIGRR